MQKITNSLYSLINVIHIVPTITQEADGVADVVRNLCECMNNTTIGSCRLVTLDRTGSADFPNYVKAFPLSWGPPRLGRSLKMKYWINNETQIGKINIIHSHGLWMMPNVYASKRMASGTYLIASPHGMLSSWSLKRNFILKFFFWWLFQLSALKLTACIHATSEMEYQDIRKLGFKQPVCIIPCGVNMPAFIQNKAGPQRQLLFLSRMHPKKGVNILLEAWSEVEEIFPGWDLILVGPDNDGYLEEMKMLASKLRIKRAYFKGALFGKSKLQAYRDASLYVLPTHSENFGITVAEALAAGTPAIVTNGAPWAGLKTEGAGWSIEIGVAPLVFCLKDALSRSPEELNSMGKIGYEWMKRDFSWEEISSQFLITYEWIINGGEAPSWVKTV